MKQLRWMVAVLCALAFVAAACGGDDDDEPTPAAPSSDSGDDASGAEPDEEMTEPDEEMTEPDEEMTEPDEEMTEPDEEMTEPDEEMTEPDEEMTEPDEEMTEPDEEMTEPDEEAMMAYDYGVDPESMTIQVGVNTDLSGIFAPLTTKITDGHKAYWEWLNANGGIQGWTVEPVVLDNAYDVPTHLENYEVMAGTGDDSVVMFSTSTGSPHTAAIAEALIEDNMAAIPLSWSSNWPDPEFGQNVFEVQTNYCIEGMNGATYMSENHGSKVAIATFPGEYGEDGAAGVKLAAEALGLEVVYDGTGLAVPGSDLTPVVAGIVESGADWVWLTTNPTTAAQLMGGAAGAGFTGQWSGNSPSWNPALLNTAVAPIADANYTHSTYTVLWGVGEAEGMQEMISAMREFRPDAPFDDVYIISWIEGYVATQILDQAISNNDLTRAGVLAAANQVTADLKGLAPSQTWSGDPNDNVVRETYLYDVDLSLYTPGATVSDEAGNNGYRLIKGPYASETALAWEYERCVKG